ncbi:hypothetical protein [Klebsiella variicola]|uniref:hypothetical protein n=1 Tax=Klebsiella variicola TaxID=244366 RepID=UPI001865D9B3|nr:hypothetical protein [Klebsiella variicola]
MTKSTITDERITSVIERLEHYACNLKWTNVRGAQDLLTAADGLRELQERRKADSEPVAYIDKQWTLVYYIPPMSMGLKIGDKLYRYAQPAPVVPVTDAMAYAFHHALTDSPLGDDDVEDIKAGLRAALVNVFNTQPPPQEVHDEK